MNKQISLVEFARQFNTEQVLFKNDDPDEDDTQPVWVRTLAAGSTMQGGSYIDFDGNIEDTAPNTVTLDNFNEGAPGLFNLGLTPDGGGVTSPFVLMVNEIGGKYVMFGISENDDGTGGGYNVLLVEL